MTSDSTALQQVETEVLVAFEEVNDSSRKLQNSCSSTCLFSKTQFIKLDTAQRSKTIVKLCGLIIFYTIVMVIEIYGGLKANSLAILTDAVHLFSDIVVFSISIFTVWVSGWEATKQQSFGYHRLEVLGALVSMQLIWLVSASLIYEAINRLVAKITTVDGKLMFLTAAFGFVFNFIMVVWLGHDQSHHCHSHHAFTNGYENHAMDESSHGEGGETTKLVSNLTRKNTEMLNINIQGAYLHLVTDLVQSVGVMIAGSIIWLKPEWLVVDLICTLIFSVVALSTTLSMLKNIFSILMERAPNEIDTASLENGLKLIEGVRDVHDLHVWAITVGKYVLACHVEIGPEISSNEILHSIRVYCERTFGIRHVTIQIELE